MLIGIDGNEANVKNRVGSGQYAYELLRQFVKPTPPSHSGESFEVSQGKLRDSRIKNPQKDSGQARMTNGQHQFVIYLKDQPRTDLPKETANFKYKIFGPKILWTQIALPINLMLGRRPDVFFSMAHYGPRFSKVPYVVTIHDLSYLHYPELFKKNDLLQLQSWTKYSIKNSAYIIAVSQTTKDDIVKSYKVDPSKITITYEGYDEDRFKPQPESKVESVKSKYKIKGDYIIFVGTLQPRKNLERLIEAFDIVNSKWKMENGKLQLVIVGKKGWLYDSIFAKVKELNLNQRVIFTDYVPDDDLPVLIAGAKAYVLPSLWEGFGIPVIEAQACGIPVIVSNTSSLPEIIGESGILIDPEDVDSIAQGIKKVLSNEKTRSDLVEKGFTNIKRFSWRNCAKETLAVLENVAKLNP